MSSLDDDDGLLFKTMDFRKASQIGKAVAGAARALSFVADPFGLPEFQRSAKTFTSSTVLFRHALRSRRRELGSLPGAC